MNQLKLLDKIHVQLEGHTSHRDVRGIPGLELKCHKVDFHKDPTRGIEAQTAGIRVLSSQVLRVRPLALQRGQPGNLKLDALTDDQTARQIRRGNVFGRQRNV